MNDFNNLFAGMRASSSALTAERTRMDVIAKNIANADVTRTPDGRGPYRRQVVHFAPLLERMANGKKTVAGVRVVRVAEDQKTPLERVFDPAHPDADGDGMVLMSNVNTTKEMADMITAARAYEANLNAQDNFVRMAERALRLVQ